MNLCAYPGCTNPARSTKHNSTCSEAHKKNLWRAMNPDGNARQQKAARAARKAAIDEVLTTQPCAYRNCINTVTLSNKGTPRSHYCSHKCKEREYAARAKETPGYQERRTAARAKSRETCVTGLCGNRECRKPVLKNRKYCNNTCGNRERHLLDFEMKGLHTVTKEPQAAGQGVAHIKRASHVVDAETARMDKIVLADWMKHPERRALLESLPGNQHMREMFREA